mgnify:CR=1 FL=1
MENFQNRGQGTLNSIMGMVAAFLVLDIAIGLLMFFCVNLTLKTAATDNNAATPAVTKVAVTDNSSTTDNSSN